MIALESLNQLLGLEIANASCRDPEAVRRDSLDRNAEGAVDSAQCGLVARMAWQFVKFLVAGRRPVPSASHCRWRDLSSVSRSRLPSWRRDPFKLEARRRVRARHRVSSLHERLFLLLERRMDSRSECSTLAELFVQVRHRFCAAPQACRICLPFCIWRWVSDAVAVWTHQLPSASRTSRPISAAFGRRGFHRSLAGLSSERSISMPKSLSMDFYLFARLRHLLLLQRRRLPRRGASNNPRKSAWADLPSSE